MISKSQIALIRSLSLKKYRKQHGLFVAEGEKVVGELLTSGLAVTALYATAKYRAPKGLQAVQITDKELASISHLETPNGVVALARIPEGGSARIGKGITLALDDIRDPGNMGTLLRAADWFGCTGVLASRECVDVWNPKVVQSSMGSVFRVQVMACGLEEVLEKSPLPVIAGMLGGENVYKSKLPKEAVLVIGSESHGVSPEVLALATRRVSIPNFGKAESLNAAVAAGILLSEMRRG